MLRRTFLQAASTVIVKEHATYQSEMDSPPMSERELTRRQLLVSGGALGAAAAIANAATAGPPAPSSAEPFKYCFNTSTIRGQKLDVPAQIDVAAAAGYSAVELWVGDLQDFARKGGSLRDLANRVRDRGLAVPSAIRSSPGSRTIPHAAQGLEQAKREMDLSGKWAGRGSPPRRPARRTAGSISWKRPAVIACFWTSVLHWASSRSWSSGDFPKCSRG